MIFVTSKGFLGSNAWYLPKNAKVSYTKIIFFLRINDLNIYLIEVIKDGKGMKIYCKLNFWGNAKMTVKY